MNIADRVESYRLSVQGQKYPDSVPRVSTSGRFMDGTWIMGQDYRAKSSLYGSFPPRFMERTEALVPEHVNGKVLHVFSGSLPPGPYVRVDLSKERVPAPDVLGNALALPFLNASFDVVFADPPYSKEDAKRYKVPMPDRRKVLHELARVTKVGGTLVWLDTQVPMFRKDMWHWWGGITIIRSTNHRVRYASFFTRTPISFEEILIKNFLEKQQLPVQPSAEKEMYAS